jgi:hypothetical protein
MDMTQQGRYRWCYDKIKAIFVVAPYRWCYYTEMVHAVDIS